MGGRGVTLSEGALGGGPRIGLGAGPGDTAASYCESPVHLSGNKLDLFGETQAGIKRLQTNQTSGPKLITMRTYLFGN